MGKELSLEKVEALKKGSESAEASFAELGVRKNGIVASATDSDEQAKLQSVFSVEIDGGDITNQQRSGRCWMFAGLNMLREKLFAKLNVKTFELSQAYLQYYDKLEKANFALERAIELATQPISSRLNAFNLDMTIGDGGHWAMFVSLVKKYGVLPSQFMPDTQVSCHTDELNAVLSHVLADDIHALRASLEKGESEEEVRLEKEAMLQEVTHILTISLGMPPKDFVLEYRDKDNKFVRLPRLTPKEFYDQYIGLDLDEWISLSDAQTYSWKKKVRYTSHYVGNVEGGDPIIFFDVPLSDLKAAVIKSLEGGDIVWFAADVSQESLRKEGLLGANLIRYDKLFGFEEKLSKGEQLDYHSAYCNHAMAFTGVNLVDGVPDRFKVENSWGKDNGDKGYFVMDDAWFDRYVYQVLVNKKYLTPELLSDYEQSPLEDVEPFNGLWLGLD